MTNLTLLQGPFEPIFEHHRTASATVRVGGDLKSLEEEYCPYKLLRVFTFCNNLVYLSRLLSSQSRYKLHLYP